MLVAGERDQDLGLVSGHQLVGPDRPLRFLAGGDSIDDSMCGWRHTRSPMVCLQKGDLHTRKAYVQVLWSRTDG